MRLILWCLQRFDRLESSMRCPRPSIFSKTGLFLQRWRKNRDADLARSLRRYSGCGYRTERPSAAAIWRPPPGNKIRGHAAMHVIQPDSILRYGRCSLQAQRYVI